jgi:hypothetical protein
MEFTTTSSLSEEEDDDELYGSGSNCCWIFADELIFSIDLLFSS